MKGQCFWVHKFTDNFQSICVVFSHGNSVVTNDVSKERGGVAWESVTHLTPPLYMCRSSINSELSQTAHSIIPPIPYPFRKKESVEIRISLEEIMKLVRQIEEDMYKAFKDTSHRYKAKYRTLMFNLKDPRNKVSN